MSTPPPAEGLEIGLRALKLPSFLAYHAELAVRAEREGWSFSQYLYQLVQQELEDRARRRIERRLKQSRLPLEKTLETLDKDRLPTPVRRQLPVLCQGDFVDRADNLLVFGLPGRGKTHLVCAIAHQLILRGFRVLFTPTYSLVQKLLAARRELTLEHILHKFDAFDAIVLDDIGYIQQDRDEMEVLFTFLSERYERKTVVITSNLVFSQWDRIFKDPMTTAAAVDRLVHHATIIELTGPSYRADAARTRNRVKPATNDNHPTTTTKPDDNPMTTTREEPAENRQKQEDQAPQDQPGDGEK